MKLSKIAEIGAALGAATLAGLNVLKQKPKKEEHKKALLKPHHLALCSFFIAAGLALWDMKRLHDHHLAA